VVTVLRYKVASEELERVLG